MKERIFTVKMYLEKKFKLIVCSKNNSSLIVMVILIFIYLLSKLIGSKI